MKIGTLDDWLNDRGLGTPKRIRPSKAPGPDLANRPVITYPKSIAIPPQNLAYRWLYQQTDVYMAVPLADAVPTHTTGVRNG